MTDEALLQQFKSLEDRISAYILDLRKEMAQRLELVEQRLDYIGTSLNGIQMQMPAFTKQGIEIGSMSSKVLNEIADLRRRIEKLESAA